VYRRPAAAAAELSVSLCCHVHTRRHAYYLVLFLVLLHCMCACVCVSLSPRNNRQTTDQKATQLTRIWNLADRAPATDKPHVLQTGEIYGVWPAVHVGKFDRGLSWLLHNVRASLVWCTWVSQVQARRHDVRLNTWPSTPVYLVDFCQPVSGVASRQHLWSANRRLLVVPRYT